MTIDKTLYQIALTQINGVGITLARNLMQMVGDEEAVFKETIKSLSAVPQISRQLAEEILDPQVMERAKKEWEFVQKNEINVHFFAQPEYPQRLTHCIDAPILLYSRGNMNFNTEKAIGIVGTRRITEYGQEFTHAFVADLAKQLPQLLIISGLAYGADITAHRAALANNLPTIGVLAHGLDRIYPAVHRKTAIEMLSQGGLLTEYPSQTNPDRYNFVTRNRIVAGMVDALVVIESAEKGGSLITADIANSYFREVFALPGRVTDAISKGCNQLIADNKAVLLQDAKSLIRQMGWDETPRSPQPKQRALFLDLSPEEEKIFNTLNGTEGMQINQLAIELDTPVSELFMTLLEMEMKNLVKAWPGGVYKLL